MIPSATGNHFAILAILCTLAIFFFPLVSGPYPVTHGPVADFETVRAAQLLLLIMTVAALSALTRLVHHFALITCGTPECPSNFIRFLPSTQVSILRC